MEIGSTKQILINYSGLPATAVVSFYILTLIYRLAFMKDKRKDKKENKKEINDKEEKNKKVE